MRWFYCNKRKCFRKPLGLAKFELFFERCKFKESKFCKNSNFALCNQIEMIWQKDLAPENFRKLGELAIKWKKSGFLTEDEVFDVVALLTFWWFKITGFREDGIGKRQSQTCAEGTIIAVVWALTTEIESCVCYRSMCKIPIGKAEILEWIYYKQNKPRKKMHSHLWHIER